MWYNCKLNTNYLETNNTVKRFAYGLKYHVFEIFQHLDIRVMLYLYIVFDDFQILAILCDTFIMCMYLWTYPTRPVVYDQGDAKKKMKKRDKHKERSIQSGDKWSIKCLWCSFTAHDSETSITNVIPILWAKECSRNYFLIKEMDLILDDSASLAWNFQYIQKFKTSQ